MRNKPIVHFRSCCATHHSSSAAVARSDNMHGRDRRRDEMRLALETVQFDCHNRPHPTRPLVVPKQKLVNGNVKVTEAV